MKKIFTFLVAFLTTVSGAVWAETNPSGTSETSPYDLATRGGLEITDDGVYYVYSSSETNNRITVDGSVSDHSNPTIHLVGININVGGTAIHLKNYSNPTFIITGENKITSQGSDAAIKVYGAIAPGASFTVDESSTGILDIEMTGNNSNVAIGDRESLAGTMADCGSVTINGGTIKTNGNIGEFDQHAFRFGGNAIVIANNIEGFNYNAEERRSGGLLFLNDDTPYVGEFHNAADDPEFTLSSPLPEPYKIEVRSGGVEVTIGEGQSLTESQVIIEEGGTLNAYKVSYESSTELPFTVPSTKYHGPMYSTESLSDDTKDYQGGKYALVTTNVWESTAKTPAWVAAGEKQDSKTPASGVQEVKYALVGTLTTKELNLKADEGLTTEFSLWYPASITITATEEGSTDDGDLSAYGMQMTNGTIQKAESFTSLTETPKTQEVQINLSALPSVLAIEPAVLKINVDADVTAITDPSINITLANPNWVYDGKEKNVSDLVTVQEVVDEKVVHYTYDVDYTLEFSLDKDTWTSVTPKDANDAYYVKVIGKNVLSDNKILGETVSIAKAALTINVTTTPRVDVGTDLANVEFPASTFLAIETAVEGEDVNLVGNLTVKEGVSADTEKTIDDAFSYDNVELKADEETSSPFKESNYTVTWPDKISLIVGKITINPGGDGEGGEGGDDVIGGEDENNDDNLDFILIHPDGEDQCSVYDGEPHGLDVLYIGEYRYKLVEGTDYTVSYAGLESGEPVNARDYTATITLLAGSNYQLEGDEQSFDLTIHIAERPVTVGFDLPASIDASTETLDASDYADWQKEGVVPNEGLVNEEEPICEGTLFLVESEDYPGYFNVYLDKKTFKVEDNPSSSFLVSNYIISVETKDGKIELEENGEGGETLPDDPNNPDDPIIDGPDEDDPTGGIEIDDSGSTGGSGISTKRYRLYLANQDYLNTGDYKKYYDELGLVLHSRHNQKYTTNTDKSFTIWYTQDGEVNAGGFRVFMSNHANGEYKEVKLDEVSGYYQIRNVTSNVYVKLCWSNGHPVANEDITATDARAYAQPNKIVVITPQPTDVQIISMAGAVVATDKVTGQREFANLTEGVYIVRMGETVVKLQVRK